MSRTPVSLAVAGQAAIRRDVRDNGDPRFRAVRDLLRGADLAFVNFESTVKGRRGGWSTKTSFVADSPPELLDALRELGFDLLSLANNHSFDLGPEGVLSVMDEASDRGFLHAGVGADLASATLGGHGEVAGRRVALHAIDAGPAPDASFALDAGETTAPRPGVNHLRVTPTFLVTPQELAALRGIKGDLAHESHLTRYRKHSRGSFLEAAVLAHDELDFYGLRFKQADVHRRVGMPDEGDLQRNLAAIERSRASADLVVVYLHSHHWEADWEDVPGWLTDVAHRCVDAGADVFVSDSVPIPLGIEIYEGKPILYGLGNLFFHSPDPTKWVYEHVWHGAIATSRFDDQGTLRELWLDPYAIGGETPSAEAGAGLRDVPMLVGPDYGERILAHFATLSARFGTELEIDNGRGLIAL